MIHYFEQGSDEWHAIRIGKATSSKANAIIKKLKGGGYSAAREDYAYDLAIERLTGESQDPDLSRVSWVQDGKNREEEARQLYSFMFDAEPVKIGFATHPTIDMFGASTDSLVGDNGLLEIKCPKAKTHYETLLNKQIPSEYIAQVDSEVACAEREWVDFVSYHPSFPPHLRLIKIRRDRNERAIAELEAEVKAFLAEVSETVKRLEELK